MAAQAGITLPGIARHARMDGIYYRLAVFVAAQTGEVRAVDRIGVTCGAVGPRARMFAGEDGEVRQIVFQKISRLSGWMAAEARVALPRVAGHSGMGAIHSSLIVLMTVQAVEHAIVGRIGVTCRALGPGAGVTAGEYGEERIVIAHAGRSPEVHLMAVQAFG